jgi:hypothetical protein
MAISDQPAMKPTIQAIEACLVSMAAFLFG